jgi:hypothetical protein
MKAMANKQNLGSLSVLKSRHFDTLFKVAIVISLITLSTHGYAADGVDPLEGTDGGLIKSLGSGGTGRKFLYLCEAILSAAAYIKTKNLLVFGGVVALAIFLDVVFKVAGIG